jgi:PKD repeat protein
MYRKEGNYTVTLMVSDDEEVDWCLLTVSVKPRFKEA